MQYTATIQIESELTHGVLLAFLCAILQSGKYTLDKGNEMVVGTVSISARDT
jgi:hypothetical protein